MIFKFRKVCEGNLFGGGDFFSIFAFKLFLTSAVLTFQ